MKRIWTPISAAAVLVAAVAAFAWTPTDYVIRSPGPAVNLLDPADPALELSNRAPNQNGQTLVTTMSQTAQNASVSLLDVIAGYIAPNREVVPHDAVYSPGQTPAEAEDANRQRVDSLREQALAAGVAQSGRTVITKPKVVVVRQNGPAYQQLFPGDIILEIDNTSVSDADEVRAYIRNSKQVGDTVVLKLLRGQATVLTTIDKLAGSSTDGTVPSLGATFETGYWFEPDITVSLSNAYVDPAQGLGLALATYDLLSDQDYTAGRIVAAAGQISADGAVGFVSGINEHVRSAWNAKAQVFFMPRENCSDLTSHFDGMVVVPVASLAEAVGVMPLLGVDSAHLPHC